MPLPGAVGSPVAVPVQGTRAIARFAFGSYELNVRARRLLRTGTAVELTQLQFGLLHALVARAGKVVPKDTLIALVWGDVSVGDNSLERIVSTVRAVLDTHDRGAYIRTVSRRGYQFAAEITAIEDDATDVDIDILLAPYRACFDGRAALETLTRDEIVRARRIFEGLVAEYPERSTYHVGLAIACVLLYESTRADPDPDIEALKVALVHARKASQLNERSAEASATLGVVLERIGDRQGAIVALQRACLLENDIWLHFCRLAAVSWGDARVRAARRTLLLCPGFPMAHWLAATVPIARRQFADAERDIDTGIESLIAMRETRPRFLAVALFRLKGLLCLARGDVEAALEAFERELEMEPLGHFYARECCANVWYAKGAVFLRRGDLLAAREAFLQALKRIAQHPLAMAGLEIVEGREGTGKEGPVGQVGSVGSVGAVVDAGSTGAAGAIGAVDSIATVGGVGVMAPALAFERHMARAALLVEAGDVAAAVKLLVDALIAAPPGDSGWQILLDPLLNVSSDPKAWAPVMRQLIRRAL